MFVRFRLVCPNINDQGWSLVVRVWTCGWIRVWHHFLLITLELFRGLLLYIYTEGCVVFSYGFLRVKIIPKIGSTWKTPRKLLTWHHLKMGGKPEKMKPTWKPPSLSSFVLNLLGAVIFCSNIWVPKNAGTSLHFSLKLKEPIRNWRILSIYA